MSSKYSLTDLQKVVSNPSLIRSAARAIYEDIFNICLDIDRRWYCWRYGRCDDNILDAEWDNLIILDAARPEFLDAAADDGMQVETTESPASYSGGFLSKVFNGSKLHDTVYITANPFTTKLLEDDVFHAVINLLESDWDSEVETVRPQTVIETARDARQRFPKKKLVIHFMQPHHPFLGDRGEQIEDGISESFGQAAHPWDAQMYGHSKHHKALIAAYRENHDIAMEAADELVSHLDGRTVITADHANLMGERGFPIPIRLYGHPAEFPHPNLVSIPVIKREGEPREVVADPPLQRACAEESVIDERLDSLGYR